MSIQVETVIFLRLDKFVHISSSSEIMAVTLQQIADLAGVSRRTVDRALNNKGRVKIEVAEKIKKIAKELNYQPSRAGRALVIAKRNLKIGVILQSANTPFMKDVLRGLSVAQMEAESLGVAVEIYKINNVNTLEVANIMEQMHHNGVNGVALTPSDDIYLMQLIDKFVHEYNIPVVTFNTDLKDSPRLCFIGQDTIKAGQTAAGLISAIMNRKGKVYIFSGYRENPSLINRINGFNKELVTSYPDIDVLGIKYYYDDDQVAEVLMDEVLKQCPDVSGVYVTGSAVGICRAVEKAQKIQQVKIIANDLIDENIYWLKKDVVDFLIGQDGYMQGYKAIMVLFKKLLDGTEPENECLYTEIVIKNKYNV